MDSRMKSNVNQKKQPEGSDPSVSGIRKGLAAANMKTGEFGMVSRVENDCVVMPIRCTVDGTLCQEEVVMPESDCRPASSEQKTVLQRLFNGRRLCWDPRKALVKVNDFQPADGERIRVSVLGEPVATGIFRHVDDQSRAVFYCLLMKNGSLRCLTLIPRDQDREILSGSLYRWDKKSIGMTLYAPDGTEVFHASKNVDYIWQ